MSSAPSTPTKTKIASLTPIQIPGKSLPRRVVPSQPWSITTPSNKAGQSNGAAQSNSSPSRTPQPLKGILKTPDREKYGGGSPSRSNSVKKSKKKKKGRPSVSFTDAQKARSGLF